MRSQRSFNLEFKRQVVEELMGGESRPAQHDADIISYQAYFTTGKINTAGAGQFCQIVSFD
jgi:hypothetical protein